MQSTAAPRTCPPYPGPTPSGSPLAPRHLAELRDGSGIPEAVIAERGYRTVTDPAELVRLGFASWQALPGLLIPLHDATGANGRYSLKPDRPRTSSDGKVVKYESQSGMPPAIDVPVRCLEALHDPTIPVWLTEGCKKADALAAAGKCAVAIAGVWAWVKKGRVPLDDFAPLLEHLNGRVVVLCFDSDPAPKTVENVRYALRCLTNWLRESGAWVSWAILPAEPGRKIAADGYLLEHSAAELDALVDTPDDVLGLKARIRELEQQLSAIGGLMYNPTLSAADKVGTFAIATDTGWRESRHETAPYRVNYGRLARCGLSTDTLGGVLKRLDAAGVVSKKTRREATGVKDAKGKDTWISTVELVPQHPGGATGLLRAAAAVAIERPKHGGYHPRPPTCPDHPGATLEQREVLLHFNCGCVVAEAIAQEAGERLNWQDAVSETTDPDPLEALKPQDAVTDDEVVRRTSPESVFRLPPYVRNAPQDAVSEVAQPSESAFEAAVAEYELLGAEIDVLGDQAAAARAHGNLAEAAQLGATARELVEGPYAAARRRVGELDPDNGGRVPVGAP